MSIEKLLRQAEEKKKAQENKPKLEIVTTPEPTQPTVPTQPIIHNQSNLTNVTNPASNPQLKTSVAPEKDFTKVPNSLARHAVPERLFKGMSKNTYDALYLKTRGAINPVRRIRATKSDLLRWTGVSDVTLDKHVRHLKLVGLLKVELVIGSHEGNWYEVFIPEELPNQPNVTHPTNHTNPILANQPKKVGGETPNLVGGVGWVETPINIGQNESPKTSYKTNTSDDEEIALSGFAGLFAEASKRLTGKGLSRRDREKWNRLAELLILELDTAARRSGEVSSVPAFLTEVLRRKLHAAPTKSKTKIDTVGKSESGEYEIKPLDKQGREAALEQLQEFAGDEMLHSFEKWYTQEDWNWLIKSLETK